MKRFYDGSIQGSFWYGIQNSDDASFFGVELNNKYYCICDCIVNNNDNYCKCCFSSYEEHIESIKKKYNIDYSHTFYISLKKISYTFTKNNINKLEEKIEELNIKTNKFIEKYEINNIGCEEIPIYKYEYKLCKDPKFKDLRLLSRLFLGKLILYCIQQNDVCIFNCNLL
jgi:hypothetical protein